METKKLRYLLEISALGIHYYSAVCDSEMVELQVALHKSGLISKINFVSIERNKDRITVSKEEFEEAYRTVSESFSKFVGVPKLMGM